MGAVKRLPALAKPDVHAKVMCSSQHTCPFSLPLKPETEWGFYFQAQRGSPSNLPTSPRQGMALSGRCGCKKRFVWNVTFYLALLGGWGVSCPLGSTAGPSPSACLSPSHVPLHGFQRRQKPHIKILDPRVLGCFLASGALWTFLLLRHISCVCVCVRDRETDR